jgi:hypothetical protein
MMSAVMMTHPVCYALSVMAHINLLLLPLLLENFLTESNIMGEFSFAVNHVWSSLILLHSQAD